MSFIIIAAAMLLAAFGFIGIPLLRSRRRAFLETEAANHAVYEKRLNELQADVDAGALDESDFASARRDLEADFSVAPDAAVTRKTSRGWMAAIAAAAIVPIVAAVLYLNLGSWRSAIYGDESLPSLVANVAARLENDPGDLAGWRFLGAAYSRMEQYPRAVDAWQHAVQLTSAENADLLARLGAAQMMAHDMQARPASALLFDKALKIKPENTRALLFGGISAMQLGRKSVAIKRWQRLLHQDLPKPLRQAVASRLAAAGGTPPAKTDSTAAAAPSAAIEVKVDIAPDLRQQAPTSATLFVFVRPADANGGPPLAARRLDVEQFPVKVKLSDADAMIPGHHLEDYQNLRVVARISKSGGALKQPGDVYGSTGFAWTESRGPLDIVLNRIVGAD